MTRTSRIVAIAITIMVIVICSGCGQKTAAKKAEHSNPPPDKVENVLATVVGFQEGGLRHGYRTHRVVVQFASGALMTLTAREDGGRRRCNLDGTKYPSLAPGSRIRIKVIQHFWFIKKDPKTGNEVDYRFEYQLIPIRST